MIIQIQTSNGVLVTLLLPSSVNNPLLGAALRYDLSMEYIFHGSFFFTAMIIMAMSCMVMFCLVKF